MNKRVWLLVNLGLGQFGGGLVAMLLHQLVALRTQLQEGLGFLVKPLAVIAVKRRLLQDAEHRLGPEIILIVKTMHRGKNVIRRQSGILDVRQLVSAFIHHLVVAHHESVLHGVVVEFGAGIGVGHRNLNGFHVQLFGERDGVVDGLVRLARQVP